MLIQTNARLKIRHTDSEEVQAKLRRSIRLKKKPAGLEDRVLFLFEFLQVNQV